MDEEPQITEIITDSVDSKVFGQNISPLDRLDNLSLSYKFILQPHLEKGYTKAQYLEIVNRFANDPDTTPAQLTELLFYIDPNDAIPYLQNKVNAEIARMKEQVRTNFGQPDSDFFSDLAVRIAVALPKYQKFADSIQNNDVAQSWLTQAKKTLEAERTRVKEIARDIVIQAKSYIPGGNGLGVSPEAVADTVIACTEFEYGQHLLARKKRFDPNFEINPNSVYANTRSGHTSTVHGYVPPVLIFEESQLPTNIVVRLDSGLEWENDVPRYSIMAGKAEKIVRHEIMHMVGKMRPRVQEVTINDGKYQKVSSGFKTAYFLPNGTTADEKELMSNQERALQCAFDEGATTFIERFIAQKGKVNEVLEALISSRGTAQIEESGEYIQAALIMGKIQNRVGLSVFLERYLGSDLDALLNDMSNKFTSDEYQEMLRSLTDYGSTMILQLKKT